VSKKKAFTSVCRKCRKEVSVWEMELEPEWICYDCLDKEGGDVIQGHDPGDEND